MSNVIQLTQDGSQTLFSETFDATYHSIFGAIEEAIHVFIAGGLDYAVLSEKRDISVFEMGFGTGLNAWLTYIAAKRRNLNVHYTGIELFPVKEGTWSQLTYVNQIPCTDLEKEAFQELHKCKWDEEVSIADTFTFQKLLADITVYNFEPSSFDIIYYDAFAPNTQGILWEEELHTTLYNSLKPGGALVTYCAKGVFKRMLKSLGYTLDSLNGPHRKHEMTRAIKPY